MQHWRQSRYTIEQFLQEWVEENLYTGTLARSSRVKRLHDALQLQNPVLSHALGLDVGTTSLLDMGDLTSELDSLVGQPFFDKFAGNSTTVQDITYLLSWSSSVQVRQTGFVYWSIFSVIVARPGEVIAPRWLWTKGWHSLLQL